MCVIKVPTTVQSPLTPSRRIQSQILRPPSVSPGENRRSRDEVKEIQSEPTEMQVLFISSIVRHNFFYSFHTKF